MIDSTIELSKLDKYQLTDLQKKLKDINYYKGDIDGLFGKQTSHAWAKFKADHYLGDTTLIGTSSYNLLNQLIEKVNIDWSDFNQKISKYFTTGEVAQGLTNDGRYVQYKERIPQTNVVKNNALRLASKLDKVREEWGSPLLVTSWYRPPDINRRVGGVSDSQHINGSAADIRPANGEVIAFERWLDKRWNMALGFGARKKGFVHLDLRSPGQRIRWNY